MEVKAVGKYMRVQPRKVRIVADEVRGKNAAQAAQILRFHPSKGARFLRKILVSAMANASENNNLSPETLRIARIQVDEGPRLKRIQARAMGRAFRIVKKTSHITVVVEEAPPEARIKPHGTKAKPRPTLEAPKKAKRKDTEAIAAAAPEEGPVEETTENLAVEAVSEEVVETPVEAVEDAGETPADSAAETDQPAEEAPDAEAEAQPATAEEQKEGEN